MPELPYPEYIKKRREIIRMSSKTIYRKSTTKIQEMAICAMCGHVLSEYDPQSDSYKANRGYMKMRDSMLTHMLCRDARACYNSYQKGL